MDVDIDYDLEYESGFESEDEEVAPELYCVHSHYVGCKVGDQQFKVHIRCWPQLDLRNQVVITAYRNQVDHLCVNAPYSCCASCRQNIYFIDLAANCDTCALLNDV